MRLRQRPSPPRRRIWIPAALALLVGPFALPPPAGATIAMPLAGAFSITPARRYVTGRPPLSLASTRVANTTQSALDVRVVPVLLTQLPAGTFTYELAPGALQAAQRILSSTQRSFVLAPGEARAVALRWRGLPHDARTADVGIIYQATPAATDTPVRVVEQLLAVDILRLPGHYRSEGQLTAIHVTQARPGTLRFVLDARNSGQAVASPSRLVLTIHGATGRRLLARGLPTDIVLPGATREFTLDLTHRLPAGRYTAIGHMALGSSHDSSAATTFQLAAPNELPSSQLQLGPLVAQGTVDHGASVTAQARNTGNASGTLRVTLRLYRLSNGVPTGRPIATRTLTTQPVAPGSDSRLRDELGHLHQGTYRLLASYQTDGTPETLVADFQAQQPLDLLAQLRGVSREHALLLPGLLMLLAAATVTLLLAREHQHRNAMRAARRHIHELERR